MIMPKPIPPYITDLIETYQHSQAKLIDIIARQEAKGNVTTYRKAVLADVTAELDILDAYVKAWTGENIPAAYKSGTESAYAAFRHANISTGAVAINAKVVRTLVVNASAQLREANAFVGRRLADEIRKAGIDAIAEKVSTGSTVKQAKKNLIQRLTDKGITAIRDKNGREIKLDVYAEMIARTTTREATNLGSINAVKDLGGDLVKITQHNSPCPICAAYEGRVYSLEGKTKDYPLLSTVPGFAGGYNTIHPNCGHSTVPYFPDLDDNAVKVREYSRTAGTVSDQKQRELDAYYADQKVKAARRKDRNEWEAAKTAAPGITPKSFSGYRATKRANGEKYKAIKQKLG